MNNNCKYASGGDCLCEACEAMRKALQEAEDIPKEEVEGLFCDAEKMYEDIKTQGQEN